MCHLYPYKNVKLLWKFFYINYQYKQMTVKMFTQRVLCGAVTVVYGQCCASEEASYY